MKVGDLVEFSDSCGERSMVGVIIGLYREIAEVEYEDVWGIAWRIRGEDGKNWVYYEHGLRKIG